MAHSSLLSVVHDVSVESAANLESTVEETASVVECSLWITVSDVEKKREMYDHAIVICGEGGDPLFKLLSAALLSLKPKGTLSLHAPGNALKCLGIFILLGLSS